MAPFQALELAAGELSGELALANDATAKAANTVREIIEGICEGEARILAQS